MDTRERRIIFGTAVRQAREKQRLSQRTLAAMCDTNQSYIWQVETGQVSVGLDLVCRIADALGVSVCELIQF